VATLGTAQPAAAQAYTCPAETIYDPTYGCSSVGYTDPFFYDYFPSSYGYQYAGHHDFGHGGHR
jgi:hypothetical protein